MNCQNKISCNYESLFYITNIPSNTQKDMEFDYDYSGDEKFILFDAF